MTSDSYNFMVQSMKAGIVFAHIVSAMLDDSVQRAQEQLGAECIRLMDYDVKYILIY